MTLPLNATPWNTILNCCFTTVVCSLACRPPIRLSAKAWLIITDWLVIYLKLNINNWSAPKLRSPVCLWGRFPRRRSGGGHGRGAAAGGLSVAPPSPATTAETRRRRWSCRDPGLGGGIGGGWQWPQQSTFMLNTFIFISLYLLITIAVGSGVSALKAQGCVEGIALQFC